MCVYIYIYNNKHTWLGDNYFYLLKFYGYLHFVYFADCSPVKLCITFFFYFLFVLLFKFFSHKQSVF